MNGACSSLPLLRELSADLSARDSAGRCPETVGPAMGDAGSPDLEFLIRRADVRGLIDSLHLFGFKRARPVASRRRQGLMDFCGYDGRADRIVRLRACFPPAVADDAKPDATPRARVLRDRRPVALVSGGAVIAVVGADGAGKTTAIDTLERWLRPQFRVVRIHMGRPRWSLATCPIKGLLKIAGLLAAPGRIRSLLWQTATARDRFLAYRRARRLASQGALVLCDRFPLPELPSMDGRRGAPPAAASRSRLAGLLGNRIERYNAGIGRPDLLAVLTIRPEAPQRRGEDPEERVRQRALEVLSTGWATVGARVLDAERSMSEVHQELKSWVWSRL